MSSIKANFLFVISSLILMSSNCFAEAILPMLEFTQEDGSSPVYPSTVKIDHTDNGDGTITIDVLTPLTGLLLDQSTPQTVSNGAPIFDAGIAINSSSAASFPFLLKNFLNTDAMYLYEEADSDVYLALKDKAGVAQVLLDTEGNSYITGGNVGIGTASPTHNLTIANGATSGGFLAINEDTDTGTNNATFTVPALAADTDYILPPDDGDAGEQLQTDGAGVLTWEAAGAAGATAWDDIGNPDADTTIALGRYETVLTSTLDEAAHTVLKIDNTDADLANETTLLGLEFTDDGDMDGIFIKALDNNGDLMWSLGANGRMVIGPGATDYALPTARGSQYQVLMDNGAGAVSFQTLSDTNVTDVLTINNASSVTTTGAVHGGSLQIDTTSDLEGYASIGNGSALDASFTTIIDRDFTDSGNTNVSQLSLRGIITKDTFAPDNSVSFLEARPEGVTLDAVSPPVTATMVLTEPVITEANGGAALIAATLYIKDAPTEGTSNAAIRVDSGDVIIDDNVGIGTTAPASALQVGAIDTTSTAQIVSMNLVNNAKFDMIEDLNNLIGTSNIKGFWVFDQTGATTSITDRSPNSHTLTLGGNASTLSPAVAGLCPNLTMAGTAGTTWTVADHNDFSFCNSGISDTAFSLIALVNITDATSCEFISKWATDATLEWMFQTSGTDKLGFYISHPSWAAYLGRLYNTAITGDQGAWHCYIATYDGTSLNAGLKIYHDGIQVDDTNSSSGAYTAMTNGVSVVADRTPGASANAKEGVKLVVGKELTAAEVKRVSDRLLSYAGKFI